MNIYTDPALLDVASAIEELPNLSLTEGHGSRAVRGSASAEA
jgi:hypothetical protein